MVLDIALDNDVMAQEKNLSLAELYTAAEAFTSGTMGELTPILKADGRVIGDGKRGPVTRRFQELHREHAFRHGEVLPFGSSR
jgi:branched-subunit amino acid aminotransferase/4-amino-4-deoxychorismate lyase